MKKAAGAGSLLLVCLVVFGIIGVCQGGELRKKFYKDSCKSAEDVVKNITWENAAKNPDLPAKLLRMHFHDCFVRGCDASVLINSTAGNKAERDAIPNLSLGGFEVINEIKSELERRCPGIVSCADIVALATRDSVSFQFQKPEMWEVLTGRRDGSVSIAAEADLLLPSPFADFTELKKNFNDKGLTVKDLVVLSGGHTLGVSHCTFFSNRLYNFTGNGDQDPSLDPRYAAFLKTKCKSLADTTTTVELDPGSFQKFDSHYYDILSENKGLFQSDAALLTNKGARNIATELRNQDKFFTEFAQSMKRMGAMNVLTGTEGEIRKKCSIINNQDSLLHSAI